MKVFTKEEVQKIAIENLNDDPERGDADWMKNNLI